MLILVVLVLVVCVVCVVVLRFVFVIFISHQCAFGEIKIFKFSLLIRSAQIEASDIALVRDKLHLAIVDALGFHANFGCAFFEITGRYCVIDNIDYAAYCALCVEQRCGTFYYFYLLSIKKIHIHAVVGPKACNVSSPDAVIQNCHSVTRKTSNGRPADRAAKVGNGNTKKIVQGVPEP